MRIRSWFAVILYLSWLFITGCSKKNSPQTEKLELPLVASITGDYGEWHNILGFTDSLLYIATFVGVDSINWGVMLRRFPMDNPGACDTLVLNIPEGEPPYRGFGNTYKIYSFDSDINASYRLSNQLHPGWILYPLPLGDTSEMVHVGNVAMIEQTGTIPSYQFNNIQADRMELFYVVDVHSPQPRTVAAIEGSIMQVELPYLLLFTGYGHNIYKGGIIGRGKKSRGSNEIIAVDLRNMEIVCRIPAPDSVEKLNWDVRMRITADGRLFYEEIDLISEFVASHNYIIEMDRVVSSDEFIDIVNKRIGVLRELDYLTRFSRIGFLRELARHLYIPLRYYDIETRQILVHNLETGDSTYAELLLPTYYHDDIFDFKTETFLSPRGKALFLCPINGWGFPTSNLPNSFVQVPAVSDLENPPRELSEFRKFKKPGWEMRWYLSPEKKWLIFWFYERKTGLFDSPHEHVFIPSEVLVDPSLLQPEETYTRVRSEKTYEGYRFVPGEKYVLVYEASDLAPNNQIWNETSPKLHSCDGSAESIALMASNEVWLKNVFFSPDGRYVGYICRLEGENIYHLQVRRLPNP
jgi:hypothetical protein